MSLDNADKCLLKMRLLLSPHEIEGGVNELTNVQWDNIRKKVQFREDTQFASKAKNQGLLKFFQTK